MAGTREKMRRAATQSLSGLTMLLLGSCGHELASRNPDPSRKMAPLPACIHRLDPRGVPPPGLMRRLNEEEYWQALFAIEPSKDVRITSQSRDCRGETPLQSDALAGTTLRANPFQPQTDDIVFGAGPDRLRIAWLKTHRDDEGNSAGPVVMIRSFEEHAEIYGVGVYRGPEQSRFSVVRSGDTALVLAKSDTCSVREPGTECLTMLDVFQQYMGQLDSVGGIMLERVAYGVDTERGVQGKIEYRLVSVPNFEGGGIRLHEQMTATDSLGREFRRAELDRYFDMQDGRLRPPQDQSLWDRFFPGRGTLNNDDGEAVPPEKAERAPGKPTLM